MYKRIILAYDGSASGQQALLGIQDLAHWQRPQLMLVAVVPPAELEVGTMEMGYFVSSGPQQLEDQLRERLDEGVKALQDMGYETSGKLLYGEVIREITQYAHIQKADLIVVGHQHEKSLLRRWWSGSTAKSLVEEAPCNLLIVVHV